MRSSKSLRYVIHKVSPVPEVFKFVEKHSGLSQKEMIKVFNYGLGLAIYTENQKQAEGLVAIAKKNKLNAVVAGEVQASDTRGCCRAMEQNLGER